MQKKKKKCRNNNKNVVPKTMHIRGKKCAGKTPWLVFISFSLKKRNTTETSLISRKHDWIYCCSIFLHFLLTSFLIFSHLPSHCLLWRHRYIHFSFSSDFFSGSFLFDTGKYFFTAMICVMGPSYFHFKIVKSPNVHKISH